MSSPDTSHSYRLVPAKKSTATPTPQLDDLPPLPRWLLHRNSNWYCALRWYTVAFFATLGLVMFNERAATLFKHIGILNRPWYFLVLALVLTVGNIAFMHDIRRLDKEENDTRFSRNLFVQILFDFVVLSFFVHFNQNISLHFLYLIHIVLACIFFSRAQSLLVTLAALFSYSLIEVALVRNLLPLEAYSLTTQLTIAESFVYLLSIFFIWGMIWALVSYLSALLRLESQKLTEANAKLTESHRARTAFLLHTTHELKAPFAAIGVNTQLLLKGHCGKLPEGAIHTIKRIDDRARRLTTEIVDMLQLANLQEQTLQKHTARNFDLNTLLAGCLEQHKALASEKDLTLRLELKDTPYTGVKENLEVMFSNIIVNAIIYSKSAGSVRIRCFPTVNGRAEVYIQDHGIGIEEHKIPSIFDEYYRTDAAAKHNKASTGLGLSIVRRVALQHNITIEVRSTFGEGTTFIFYLPPWSTENENGNR